MLPFIAGLTTGIVAVVAYKNKTKIKQKIEEGTHEAKKLAQTGFEKSKQSVELVKNRFEEKKYKLKEAKITEELPSKEEIK
ncbi:MAG: hypothetical protein WC141_04925 [Arcobacteraceae bacterium]